MGALQSCFSSPLERLEGIVKAQLPPRTSTASAAIPSGSKENGSRDAAAASLRSRPFRIHPMGPAQAADTWRVANTVPEKIY